MAEWLSVSGRTAGGQTLSRRTRRAVTGRTRSALLFAWSGLASAFTPVVLCALFWKGTTRAGAIAGMIAGFAGAVGWVATKRRVYEAAPRKVNQKRRTVPLGRGLGCR